VWPGVTDFIIGAMQSVTSRSPRRRAVGGFTLIELMIVVAIVAVLAMLAFPAFVDHVRKSRRADAITELNKVAQAQERWRANNPNYNNADVSSAATGLRLVGGTTVATSYNLSSGYYTIAIGTTLSSTTYTATATAAGAQSTDAKCATLTLTMTGGNVTYGSTGTATANQCWSR
jgi:type IV pilus assembly protein PilE